MWCMISMFDLRNLSKTFERKLVVFDPVTSEKVYLTKFSLKHSISLLHVCQLGGNTGDVHVEENLVGFCS